ncbi:MAG: EamA family transporter, partial [Catenulispora sp.]|nr:EamA family transporter [Catenulispora sp.]
GAGLTIATYSIVDGLGVRAAGNPLSYGLWLFLLQGPLIVAACAATAGPGLGAGLVRWWRHGVAGGLLTVAAYAIVLWAQARSPLALVSALRETSVLFALFLGGLLFAEKVTVRALAATALAVVGIAMIKIA